MIRRIRSIRGALDLQKVAGASPLQTVPGASRSEDADTDLTNLIDALRRAVRLKGRAVATEETYVYRNRRFIRFCPLVLKTEMALNRRTRRQRIINQLH